MQPDCLRAHCKAAHGWQTVRCSYEWCEFEAHHARSMDDHLRTHRSEPKPNNEGEFMCGRGTCRASFRKGGELLQHLQVHSNKLYKCHFCSWTGVARNTDKIENHYLMHFRIRSYVCSDSDTTSDTMNLFVVLSKNTQLTFLIVL